MKKNVKYIIALCIIVIGIGFLAYKIITAQSAIEISERSFRQQQEKQMQDIQDFRLKLSYYSRVMTSNNYTLTEKIDAYHKLQDLVPEYKNLSFDEVKKKLLSNDVK